MTLVLIRRGFQAGSAPRSESLRAGLVAGAAWLWRQPFLRAATLLVAGSNFLFRALFLVVIVLAAQYGAGPSDIGLLFGVAPHDPVTLIGVAGLMAAIGIVAWLDRGLPQIMFAVAMTNTPIFARILRGSLLSLREADYVIAARSVGAGGRRILFRHLLPNSLTPLIVAATLALATAIIDVAGLGFLGLGPPDPRTPEWGTMLTDATKFLRIAPWLIFFPGLAIVISAIGFNLLGDGMRESLDPRLKR